MVQKQHFILMADIQQSSKHNGKKLMQEFSETVKEINHLYKKEILSPLTITLGDEFQAILKGQTEALAIMLALEETIVKSQKTFKLRYVLHQGVIDTPINPEIAYGMLGPGLTTSRELLEKLKDRRGERFFLCTEDAEKDAVFNNLFFLYSSLVDSWKVKDKEIISLFLQHADYKIVADKMQKDRSLLWRKENSLRLREYAAIKKLIISPVLAGK